MLDAEVGWVGAEERSTAFEEVWDKLGEGLPKVNDPWPLGGDVEVNIPVMKVTMDSILSLETALIPPLSEEDGCQPDAVVEGQP